jgi:hypothetical protein
VAFEWQTPSGTGACDQAICRGMGCSERLLLQEQVRRGMRRRYRRSGISGQAGRDRSRSAARQAIHCRGLRSRG